MLGVISVLIFLSVFLVVLNLSSTEKELRPSLRSLDNRSAIPKPNSGLSFFRWLAYFNRPFCAGPLGKRIARDLAVGQLNMKPEEFILMKQITMIVIFIVVYPQMRPDMMVFYVSLIFVGGDMLPEFWLKSKVRNVKNVLVKELPDTVDLLGLCVNAGSSLTRT